MLDHFPNAEVDYASIRLRVWPAHEQPKILRAPFWWFICAPGDLTPVGQVYLQVFVYMYVYVYVYYIYMYMYMCIGALAPLGQFKAEQPQRTRPENLAFHIQFHHSCHARRAFVQPPEVDHAKHVLEGSSAARKEIFDCLARGAAGTSNAQ